MEYSNRRACYLGETLRAGGTVSEVNRETGTISLELYIKNERDEVLAPGRAIVKLS